MVAAPLATGFGAARRISTVPRVGLGVGLSIPDVDRDPSARGCTFGGVRWTPSSGRPGQRPLGAVVAALRGVAAVWLLLGCGSTPAPPPPALPPATPSGPLELQAHADAGKPGRKLLLSVELPVDAGAPDTRSMAFVSGRALAVTSPSYAFFDVLLLMDTSESTADPSGRDINGDGVVGKRRGNKYLSIMGEFLPLPKSDKGYSILSAEVAAAKHLLNRLDPRATRVGVVVFSGDVDPDTPHVHTVAPLTGDFDAVRSVLEEILERGPDGMTNMRDGLFLATRELVGLGTSPPRADATRIILFFTDGRPTLPITNSKTKNSKAAIGQASIATFHNIRIHSFGLGEVALSDPVTLSEVARVTGGVFTPVQTPGDLPEICDEVSFSDIAEIRITNLTTGEKAADVLQSADGSYAALIPVNEGENTLEVRARSIDGMESTKEVQVDLEGGREIRNLSPSEIRDLDRLLKLEGLDQRTSK